MARPIMKILDLRPTVFFTNGPDGLRQAVDVDVEFSGAAPSEVTLAWRSGYGAAGSELLAALLADRHASAAGPTTVRLFLPDLRAPQEVTFTLLASGEVHDRRVVSWQPERHWELYVVPGSHHDLGYTDLPSSLLREHDRFMDQVLDLCAQTADFPEESRYHYAVEQGWSILHYLDHAPPAQQGRMLSLLRAGRVEVTALLSNETSELCGHEEQIRLLYPAFRLARRAGIAITTAELNDIPGISWGLASVLAGAGVRYFAPGIPDYFAWGRKVRAYWDERAILPRDVPGAFWWEGPDGQRVLFWYRGGGITFLDLWSYAQAEVELPRLFARVAAGGYPFALLHGAFHSGGRDNAPPDVRVSLIAREWNARWVYPRLVLSTHSRFFRRFEALAGAGLPVLRGEMPNTDYTIGATSTARETGINRLAHSTLLAAERLAVCSGTVTGDRMAYPADTLCEAYESTLLFDEHTWGMAHPIGPAQEANWCQKAGFALRASALAHDVLVKSANRLADHVVLPIEASASGIDQTERFIVVFNALAETRDDLVTVPAVPPSPCSHPVYWRYQPGDPSAPPVQANGTAIGRDVTGLPSELLDGPLELVDLATGQEVPCQVVRLTDALAARPLAAQRLALARNDQTSLGALNWGRASALDLVFVAEAVPSMGYKTFRLRRTAGGHAGLAPQQPASHSQQEEHSSLQVREHEIESRYYRVTVDPDTGAVTSLFDKVLERELVDPTAAYGLHQVLARHPRDGRVEPGASAAVCTGEAGAVLCSLVVRGSAPGCPQLTQEITLYDRLKRVDFATRVLRDSTPHLELYAAFPFAVAQPHFRCETTNATFEPVRDQLPGTNTAAYTVQNWVTVSDPAGFGIAWSSLEAPVVSLGQLWPSPISQAHHGIGQPGFDDPFLSDPAGFGPGHLYACLMTSNFRTNFQPTQASEALFRFTLTSAVPAELARRARQAGWGAALPLHPVCLPTGLPCAGDAAAKAPLALVGSFVAIDQPNVQLLALKAAEDGAGVIARLVETEGRETEASLTLPYIEIGQACLTDLVERDLGALAAGRHTVRVHVPSCGMVTVRCRGAGRWPQPKALFCQ